MLVERREVDLDEVAARSAAAARYQWAALVGVVVVILAMLVADLLIMVAAEWLERWQPPPFASGRWWQLLVMCFVGAMVGMIAAQLLLAVAYAALGDGSSPKRVLYTAFTLAIFTNILVLFSIGWQRWLWIDAVAIFLIPMMMFFLLQIPLWGVRSCFGWSIVSPWSEARDRRPMRFTLAHVLGWSAFLAVPLCILQALMQGSGGPIGYEPLVMGLWALLLCLFLLWFLYVVLGSNFGLWMSLAATALAIPGAVGAQLAATSLLEGPPNLDNVLMLLAANTSAGAVMFVGLRLAHRFGFRLSPFDARRRERSRFPDWR